MAAVLACESHCDIRHKGAVTSNLVPEIGAEDYGSKSASPPGPAFSSETLGHFLLLRRFPPDFPVIASEIQKWVAHTHDDMFDLRNKNGVISCLLRRLQAAFQIGQRPVQHRSSVLRPVKPRSSFGLFTSRNLYRPSIILRYWALIFCQNVNPESLSRMQMGMRACAAIHAHQQKQRIERYGSQRIGGHAVNFAVQVHGDDADSGGESSHRFSEVSLIQTHKNQ